ncbi:pantetheine-phosphate adenylyltransferase family protein [Pochonia chlamydosporia 170]|uniref:Pantetheine-phosphate adenylyltransferase family protein n=1 Tax=Pochonia chlamydosporia 170 TaxID=1380566 RepID=A0A179FDQ6_METCM|nr:pantetheine-phosphate adenylyltransferase family protein [Pochonia chlamydosporia 170]OAQ63644.1 pantetheine-phosphate adenylyltransferase family protein [Pochonia chlamydosporia 170]
MPARPPSLLLLPSPPEPANADVVRAAYRGTLASVISRLSKQNQPNTTRDVAPVLVVAVSSPILTKPNSESKTRSVYWERSQSLVAELYSLIVSICAEQCIASDLEADDPGAVDVRIILVDHDPSCTTEYKPGPDGSFAPNNTVVPDLATFASEVHPWKYIFHPSSEPGYQLQADYLRYAGGKQKLLQSQLIGVDGGLSLSKPAAASSQAVTVDGRQIKDSAKSYTTVCLGGTFDHLHPGHKLFLHAAILLLNLQESTSTPANSPRCELVIGISSDELLAKKKYAEQLQSWEVRSRSVISFLSTLLNWSTTLTTETKAVQAETKELHATFRNGAILVRCVDFHDIYGPTVKQESIQALVVSGETRSGGKAVNDKRHSQGWHLLDVYEIDVLGAQGNTTTDNFESKISSTEIRKQKAQRPAESL